MYDPVIYQMQADLCHAMSHPARQQILHILFDRPQTVGEIASITHLGQSTISRHLAVLRQNGIVNSQRNGQEIICSVANPKIAEVCSLMRNVLVDQIEKKSRVAKEIS